MRRSSTDNSYLRLTLFSLFLVFIQIIGSLYTFLPLFIGVFFTYIVVNLENEKNIFYVYLSFIYLTIYDLNKGFYLFSSLLFVLLFYYMFVEKIRNSFSCTNCVLVIYVFIAYLGHALFNSLIAYILHQDLPVLNGGYFYL